MSAAVHAGRWRYECRLPGRWLRCLGTWLATSVLLLVAGNGFGQVSADAPLPPFQDFAIETWRVDNGLPQSTATAVIQNHRGYIWVGTYNGIVEFDGWRFKVFDSSNTRGLANSRVTSMWEDTRGQIWIGHDTGEVTCYADEVFTVMPQTTNWLRNPIKEFFEDEHGAVWALNQRGEAMSLAEGRIVRPTGFMAENPFVNPKVTIDAQGQTFVLRNGVVARFVQGRFEPVNFGDPSERPYYSGLATARDGQLWVLGEGRLRKWNGTTWTADYDMFPLEDVSVTTMLETAAGRLIVGTLQFGLLVFEPERGWTIFNREQGLPQDWVYTLAEDREKNLWAGTGGGLALLRARKVRMYSPPDDWQGRPVLSITRTRNGNIWAATEGAGIYRFAAGDWTRFSLGNQFVWSVHEDSDRQIWAGTWGGGLFQLGVAGFVAQTNLIPSYNPIVALKEWPVGTLWIGTGTGLIRKRGTELESFASRGGAAAGDVRAVEPGLATDEIWIGTQGAGLGHWQRGKLTSYSVTNGLAGNFILSLLQETNGTLWIGTLDQGLCRWQNGRFRSITSAQGLPANILYHIEDDQLGFLWFNSPGGIFRISKKQLNQCADDQLTRLDVLKYGKAEGMTTLAGTGGFTPSGFRAPDGQLWFSTARGIAVVNPKLAKSNPVLPPVWVEEILVDGKSVAFQPKPPSNRPTPNEVIMNPGPRQLEVLFTALSFTAPERVRFKYRLEGLDTGWTEAGAMRQVTYSFLPPGNYTFRVIACNSDGLWNEAGDLVEIRVLPHFWQTVWFKAILGMAACATVGALVYLVSRRRHRRKLERIARERALERERARIAQDIHDDLGASLTRIGLLSESAAGDIQSPERTAASLEQILATTRELTRSMDEIVWAVNPRHDTLESLTNYISRFAHDFLSTANVRCRLAMPLQLPDLLVRSEVRHNLFLACKEALHNVVKHSRAHEVRLSLELTAGGLKFTIVDNGPGFDLKSLVAQPARLRNAAGNGLLNLDMRLRQVGGHSKITSAPGAGTRVEFFVPLPESADAAG